MTIEETLDALFRSSSLTVFHKAAPQHASVPFTVYRAVESEPLNTLEGYAGITRTDFAFESWALTQQAANAMRDSVASAVRSASLNSYQLPGGESAFDDMTNNHMAPCAFSFWHTDEGSSSG